MPVKYRVAQPAAICRIAPTDLRPTDGRPVNVSACGRIAKTVLMWKNLFIIIFVCDCWLICKLSPSLSGPDTLHGGTVFRF